MAVEFNEDRREWALVGAELLYLIGLDQRGCLRNRHVGADAELSRHADWWAGREPSSDPFEEWWAATPDAEYPTRGPYQFAETVLAVEFGPSERYVQLEYIDHHISGEKLTIVLSDCHHPLRVRLHYNVDPSTDTLRRWAEIENAGENPITLEQAGTFGFMLDAGQYELHHLTGDGLDELNPVREILTPGRKVLESRRGMTGHQHQPWFALARDDSVVFGALEWSGNWKLSFETDVRRTMSVVGGMSEFDFRHELAPGATFTTPAAVLGAVRGGVDDAARRMHAFVHGAVLPIRPHETTLPVVYEGWYAAFGKDSSAIGQIEQIDKAAELGVELFIVTAGWYAPVEGDLGFLSRAGDWQPWPESYPQGLEEVADAARSRGMRFGLWCEPEAVATDSSLFRAHPDWVYQTPAGPAATANGRLVLNLARDDVRDHVLNDIIRLVKEYELDYFRTDMNQPLQQLADPSGLSGPGRDLAWRHVRSYYEILDEVRRQFPHLIIEACAGGGGRIDLGILRRTDTVWLSDNVNPLSRLSMFMSATSFLPSKVCEGWAVWSSQQAPDKPPYGNAQSLVVDVDFSFRVCMMGHLGISADLRTCPAEWRNRAAHHIAVYKHIRDTVQNGVLYRLTPPPDRACGGDWAVVAMVSRSAREAVVFCYRLGSDTDTFQVYVPGLGNAVRYLVSSDSGAQQWSVTGEELAEDGLAVRIAPPYSSELLLIEEALGRAESPPGHGDREVRT